MKLLLKIVLPLLFVAGGVVAAKDMISQRPEAERVEPEAKPTLVDALELQPSDRTVAVIAMGIVEAARSVVLQAEVAGRLETHHEGLVVGGRVSEGDVLLTLDDRDYTLAVETAKAQVSAAEFTLKVERGQQKVAEREWALVTTRAGASAEGKSLALRKPHIANAKAQLKAAKRGVERARLSVERTVVKAPFNAMVSSETLELGQYVTPQSQLATLVGTDAFWVRVAVPLDRLAWFDLPDASGEGGAAAKVVLQHGGDTLVEREGRIVRLLGDLEPRGRMARVIVEVPDPLDTSDGQMPLLLGSYVRVEIKGRDVPNVVEVPRKMLRNGDRVYVMTSAGELAFRELEVAWRTDGAVWASKGLERGDRVIASRLGTAVPGMKLAALGDPPTEPDGDGEDAPEAEDGGGGQPQAKDAAADKAAKAAPPVDAPSGAVAASGRAE